MKKRIKDTSISIKQTFKNLLTLVAMQLKDRMNISFNADKKGSLIKIALYGILLIGLTAVIYLVLYILGMLGVLGMGGMPVSMFNIFFYLLIILSILGCINELTNALFFSEDNMVLLSYPVNGDTIFFSKLVVFYILQLVKSFTTIVPMFIAYAIFGHFAWYFYPWLIFCFLLIAMLPVAIASVLSIPFMYIKMFFKKYQYLQSGFFLVFLIAITVLVFKVIELLPEDLSIATKWATVYFPAITNFTMQAETYVGPLVYIPMLLLGYRPGIINQPSLLTIFNSNTWIILLSFIGTLLVCFALSVLLAKPLFFKMASKPFEYKKKRISHDFSLSLIKSEGICNFAFAPILDSSKKNENNLYHYLERLLRRIIKELSPGEKIFIKNQIDTKRILKLLNKYQKKKDKIKFELVSLEEFKKRKSQGYIILVADEIPSLSVVKYYSKKRMYCYDPNHLPRKNHRINSFLSALWKDFLVSFRTPGELLSNYMLFIVTPLAVLILNSVFEAMKKSTQGQIYTIFFNAMIIVMILLAGNVAMSSIYSKEGKTSYLLKASPINYIGVLSSKLLFRGLVMTGSLVFTMVIYSQHCSLSFVRFDLLFFSFWFIYLGHLLWSAELDFMNPQDHLYAETGQNISNPNETVSGILVFVIAFIFAFITFSLCKESVTKCFVKIFFISLFFLLARVYLYISKIQGYKTSRTERTRN